MNLAESTIVHRLDAATQHEFAALAREVARSSAFVDATAGGRNMSVKIANAGALGWLADSEGYRYAPTHPRTGEPWPPIPQPWLELATEIAGSHPWDCAHLVWYARGAKLGWHRDKRGRPVAADLHGLARR